MLASDIEKNLQREKYPLELQRAMVGILLDIKKILEENIVKVDSLEKSLSEKPKKASFLRRIFKR